MASPEGKNIGIVARLKFGIIHGTTPEQVQRAKKVATANQLAMESWKKRG